MSDDGTTLRYPRLMRRVEAVLLDAIVLVLLFFILMNIVAPLAMHGGIKAAIVGSITVLLEPVLVSATGSSIGHHLRGLRVQDAASGANLGIVRAIFRLLVKSLLGWYSVVFMLITKRHQTVHDIAVKSVVVFKNAAAIAGSQALAERSEDLDIYTYPPKPRRVIAIVLYNVAAICGVVVLLALFSSNKCVYYNICSDADQAMEAVAGVALAASFAIILVLGWRGRLWGARRTIRTGQPNS